MSINNIILSNMNEDKWKYDVGVLVCAPRQTADNVWGTLVVMKRIVASTVKYYECWSQKANRMINMPKKTLEEGWYVPKEKNKTTTDTELSS